MRTPSLLEPIYGRPPHIVGCDCYQTLPRRGFFGQGQESAAFVGAQPAKLCPWRPMADMTQRHGQARSKPNLMEIV